MLIYDGLIRVTGTKVRLRTFRHFMYCAQCGTESHGAVQYCRTCGSGLNPEPAQTSPESKPAKEWRPLIEFRKKKTPAERREAHLTKGVVSLFSGVGLTTFLYFLSTALVLKLPPDVIQQIPFEIDPVVKVIWLLGLLPATSGLGHIIAGLLIRPQKEPQPQLQQVVSPPRELTDRPSPNPVPISVTDHTTNLLEPDRIKSS